MERFMSLGGVDSHVRIIDYKLSDDSLLSPASS